MSSWFSKPTLASTAAALVKEYERTFKQKRESLVKYIASSCTTIISEKVTNAAQNYGLSQIEFDLDSEIRRFFTSEYGTSPNDVQVPKHAPLTTEEHKYVSDFVNEYVTKEFKNYSYEDGVYVLRW